MKAITKQLFTDIPIIAAFIVLLATKMNASAIEGLQISVQSSNVVLSWSSATNETYLVQYRPTLDANSSWTTLTDSYPAAIGTNVTCFVHSNIVKFPLIMSGGTNTGFGTLSTASRMSGSTAPLVPMVKPANGSGGAVPLALYPPGTILTGLLIYNPSTGNWISGNGYTVAPTSRTQDGSAQPMDAGSGDTNQYTGFYRVVRDGVHIVGLTNGTIVSGTLQLPIEFALGSTDQIVGISFHDTNNNPIIGATGQSFGSNCWQMVWNTPMSFNGDYTVIAEIDFASDNPVASVPVTVTVSNVISFPNYFSQTFGDWMWIFAQTIPNTAYELDMYGENTNYIGSFYDYADSSGYISFIWDLTDTNGYTLDDTNFYGVFTVDTSSLSGSSPVKSANIGFPNFQTSSLPHKTLRNQTKPNGPVPAGSSSSVSAKQLWVKEPAWSPGNSWAIAYSPLAPNDPATTLTISEMMIGGDGSEYGGVVGTLGNIGVTMSPGNVWQSSAFEMVDTNSRAQFLGYLAQGQYRHFYFFGHGSPSAFGTVGAVITADDVSRDLRNVPLSMQIQHAANHPYRFVFIDGCQAGAGNLCESFAIPAMMVNTNFFANAGVPSRAFLGFKKTISYNPSQWTWRALMLGGFFSDWMSGQNSLQQCVANAEAGAHSSGYQDMDSSAVIYGAMDMTHNGP